MPTTTNYGWTTPADTDLVKDGASAIRTLGTAIDTTVFNNASAAIAKTIVDAKGDLIVATAADTVARLASSASNGDLLTVDTSTASGLKWAAPAPSGAFTLLSTTTLSGASTTVSGISASYTQLLVLMTDFYTSSGDTYTIKPNGTNSIGQNLIWAYANNTSPSQNANAQIGNVGTASSAATPATFLTIFDYANTTSHKPFHFYGNSNGATDGGFYTAASFRTTSAISSLVFAPTTGTWSGGTVKIYGVK